MDAQNQIVETIGKDIFQWLSGEFSKETTLKEIPDQILDRLVSVDITTRNYFGDISSITSIAVITFAYNMAGKTQKPQFGPKDILLLKVLAKNEKLRRSGKQTLKHKLWGAPVYELLTGEVGDKIRSIRTMNSSL